MLIELLNKVLVLVFFIACLNSIRHIYYFIQAYFTSTEEEPVKYRVSNTSLFLLGVSLSYILTAIFTGIKLY